MWPSNLAFWVEMVLAGLALVGIAGATVFGTLWWKARTTLKTRVDSRLRAENHRIDAELRLAEITDRMKIIADVHDAAAVSLTSMIAQAEGAKFAGETSPDAVVRAAGHIADLARTVLNDLRRVVNVGRQGVDELGAAPSVGSLQDLFSVMEDSGVVVQFEESGTAFGVSSSAEIALFRIAQEALNNVRIHGGPGTTVKVTMAWSTNGLQFRLEDDGTRAKNVLRENLGEDSAYTIADDQKALTEVLTGRGMKDMKSRAEAFGGVFSAHRVPGVGFTVSASFPTLRFHNGIHGFTGDHAQAS